MKRIIIILATIVAISVLSSCEADEATYNEFIGSWHLVRINANGDYRKPRPENENYYNIHFLQNNSAMGNAVSSNFSTIYNIRKNNKIIWSGFTYLPSSDDTNDNDIFLQNLMEVESYALENDTLRFLANKKVSLMFVRK